MEAYSENDIESVRLVHDKCMQRIWSFGIIPSPIDQLIPWKFLPNKYEWINRSIQTTCAGVTYPGGECQRVLCALEPFCFHSSNPAVMCMEMGIIRFALTVGCSILLYKPILTVETINICWKPFLFMDLWGDLAPSLIKSSQIKWINMKLLMAVHVAIHPFIHPRKCISRRIQENHEI